MAIVTKYEANMVGRELEFHVPTGQRQLFFDDHGIARIENLTRTMHQPAKKGAVIRQDPDNPEGGVVQTRTAPIWDPEEKTYKLWDITTPNDLHAGGIYCSGYYESKDGLHWSKPVVGQVEYRGSRENNYVAVQSDRGYFRPGLVVYNATDPDPARRYKGAIPNVGFIVSPDGVNWKMLDVPGVPSFDEYNFSFDEQEHLFILTVKHAVIVCQGTVKHLGPYGRSVWLSTSMNFEHWTEPKMIFHADDLDQELGRENIKARFADPTLQQLFSNDPATYNVDVYNMGVFGYEGLYIGMPAMYRATGPSADGSNTEGFHLVQLTCSRDLKNWKRLGDRKPFIGPSPKDAGAYDLTQIIGPSAPVVRGDELWFYYTGLKYRDELADVHTLDPDTGAICLAVLRRDGFFSLDAGETEGLLVTKPFTLFGDKVYVNADASKGELCTEVLDGQGVALAASAPLTGDRPDGEVTWTQGNMANLKGREVTLHFTLRNAKLYSFWIED